VARADVGYAQVSKDYLVVQDLKGPKYGEWGPDLVLCRLPDHICSALEADGKVFHALDLAPLPVANDTRWFWVLIGVPDEMSTHGPSEDVLATRAIGCHTLHIYEKGEYSYVDLFFKRNQYEGLPRSFGGISGGGLWAAEFSLRDTSLELEWTSRIALRGVAFYQHPDTENVATVRCHARKDVMNLVAKFA
jgi:hypothetical protein